MHDFLKTFDGSGRPPWPSQVEALRWIASRPEPVVALQLPTGVGKQAIGTAIQRQTGAVYLAPQNTLIDQAVETYPDINILKGKVHYKCTSHEGFSCHDRMQLNEHPCKGCPYVQSRRRALAGEPTFSNPIAYYYLTMHKRFQPPDYLVVDEAHSLLDMVKLLCGSRFRQGRYGFPNLTSDLDVTEWLIEQRQKTISALRLARDAGLTDKVLMLSRELANLSEVLSGMRGDPGNYVIYTSEEKFREKRDRYLNVLPVQTPQALLDQILQCNKLILMSATLPRTDVELLARGRPFAYLDLDSPIPKERRQVLYRPHSRSMNWETPEEVAAWIKKQLHDFPGRNTIVHVTYSMSKELARHFPKALTNTPETKDKVLARFKSEGGVWLASGCAEGLDLRGDMCRLNLIPILHRPNTSDPVVKKRLAMPDGNHWYDMETIKTTIQQAGRTTRGLTDESITIVGDDKFPRLITRRRSDIPKSFLEAIVWRIKEP